MSATWLDLKRPLDQRLDRLLRDLNDLFQGRSIDYLLTGGMAREILLHYGHGCAAGRATQDLDFGVTLSCWEDYEALRSALVETGTFRPDPKETQRVLHRDSGTGLETKVDLVPFGAIAGPDAALAWPPDGSHVMRVLGYAQAWSLALIEKKRNIIIGLRPIFEPSNAKCGMTMFGILLSPCRFFLLNARTPGTKRVFSACGLEFRVPKAKLTPA